MSREWDEAFAAIDVARAHDRERVAASEARLARLKHAAVLERNGKHAEAAAIIAQVRKEQEHDG